MLRSTAAVPAGLLPALMTPALLTTALLPSLALTPLLLATPAAAQDAPRPTRALAQVFAAYAAKVAASAVFVSGRTLDSVLAEELAPDAPLQALARPFLRLELDRDGRTVTASLLGCSATAAFVPGLGCTLVHGDDAPGGNDATAIDTLRRRAIAPADTPGAPAPDEAQARPWPLGDALPALRLPEDVDAEALDKALAGAFAEPDDGPPFRTRAVVVVRDGQLLAERYGPGYDARTVLPGWSMTKSWVHALLGLRVMDGALDPDAPLPVEEWSEDDDPRARLRLFDLLHMHSGLQWTEDYDAPDSDALRMLFASGDYGAVAANAPLAAEPGTVFRYSSGTTNLLCRVLRATFTSDAEGADGANDTGDAAHLRYPQERLFAPLGMRTAVLEPDPSGTFVGSSFGFATARDWARFGLLYLQDGVWDGRRLLPEGWVATALQPALNGRRGNYGAHFWLNRGTGDDGADRPFDRLPRDVFYLSGYEGQYVVCFPTQRLVVARLGCTKRGGFDLHGLLERVMLACGGP